MSRLGRLSFSDATFIEGDAGIIRLPALFRPRPEQGRAYRDRSRNFKGRKFYFHGRPAQHKEGSYAEVLKPGTHLRGVVDFTSLTAAELGLVFFALGLDGSFRLALGGGKPVAMGQVRLEATELQLQQNTSFTEYETGMAVFTGNPLQQAITHYLPEAETLILAEQRDKLREILDPKNEREAPTGVY
jgi:hypothetical protein